MNFSDYQIAAQKTAIYPRRYAIEYTSLGLAGETGEIAGKIAKVFRDKNGSFSDQDIAGIKDELGDVLWMISQLAAELGLSLDRVATDNIAKLADRQARNVIGGSGDRR